MSGIYGITELRNGTKIELDNEPYVVTYFQHVNPGKGSAFVRTKLRSLITGNTTERTFKAGDKLPAADLESMHMQFMYIDGDVYHFMNMENYDQYELSAKVLEDKKGYLKENIEVDVLFYKGKPIDIELPNHMVLKVVFCEPGLRGDTATNVTKPATVETGAIFQVPLFVQEGDVIKIDTRTGQYLERHKG